ncbi:MAG: MerC domain-containing protein [Verrucomicrobiota bacterium]
MSTATTRFENVQQPDFDWVGVAASVLCAIHCAVTPVLLIFAPAFGEIWSHPASHWLVALFVVPLAVVAMRSGFKKHGRKWIIGCGIAGVVLIFAGAVTPYFDNSSPSLTPIAENSGGEEAPACTDACCPSIQTDSEGNSSLHIPLASIITTLGGLALITTHVGNICACPKCQSKGCGGKSK